MSSVQRKSAGRTDSPAATEPLCEDRKRSGTTRRRTQRNSREGRDRRGQSRDMQFTSCDGLATNAIEFNRGTARRAASPRVSQSINLGSPFEIPGRKVPTLTSVTPVVYAFDDNPRRSVPIASRYRSVDVLR